MFQFLNFNWFIIRYHYSLMNQKIRNKFFLNFYKIVSSYNIVSFRGTSMSKRNSHKGKLFYI